MSKPDRVRFLPATLRIPLTSIWGNPGNEGRQLARTFTGLRWQIWKRMVRRKRVLRLASGAKMFAYPDCVISSAVIYADWPEYHEIQFIRKWLQPSDLVVDVGANVGHLMLLLSDVVKPENIHGFEPTPVTFERLRENWRLNGWSEENLHQLAVGAMAGKMFMANAADPITTNSVQATISSPNDVAVKVIPLDAMIPLWHGRSIGLLKVDVEGFEKEVFAGARVLLAEARPRLIMFESLGKQIEPAVAELLMAARYRFFQLDQAGRPDFAGTTAQNLFAVSQETVPQFQ